MKNYQKVNVPAGEAYPTIIYKYSNPARLKEVAKEISTMSSGSEGNSYSVLKVI